MTLLILLFLIGAVIEIKIKPRLEYVEKSSVFVFYFFAAKNTIKTYNI
jgi:hypothetical protein